MSTRPGSLAATLRRVHALVLKETRQVLRDPSSVAIGVFLPLVLILLFGYGLSLDVRNVPVAVVIEDRSPAAAEAAAGFRLSPYFLPQFAATMPDAEALLLAHRVTAIVRVRNEFARQAARGEADVQVILHGGDANTARTIEGYARGALAMAAARSRAEGVSSAGGPIVVRDRMWFNEANDSRWFLVPGLIVLVITLIGATLTALVVAREWERGTYEALFVTPVKPTELLLGKTVPYFGLGLIGLALCLLAGRFLFHVPLRGSLVVLCGASMLYLLVTLAIGLLISTKLKSQLVASQVTLIVTFLPAVMLSGFIYDLRSMPAPVRAISAVLPPRYFVSLLQTVFLAGDVRDVILPNVAVLTSMGVVLALLTRGATRKRL